LTKPVAVNTGLALPRSLWFESLSIFRFFRHTPYSVVNLVPRRELGVRLCL